jgi:hypothetical protein
MVRSCLILTAVIAGTLLPVGIAMGTTRGAAGVAAACLAAGVCWLGAVAALVCSARLAPAGRAVQAHLAGSLFRIGIPLAVGTVLQQRGGALADAGVFGLIVVFYLVALTTETVLSLKFVKRNGNSTTRV